MSNNVQRVLMDYISHRAYPVKGSVADIKVGDALFWDTRFQANTAQQTVRPASSGSAGSSAADGRYQFANLFAGIAKSRHDLNSFDKNIAVSVDCEIEMIMVNSSAVDTAATADFAPGIKVAIAVDASNIPINDRVVVVGHGSVSTIADNEAIGFTSRQIKSGDKTCRIHVKSLQVFSQTGI